MKLALLAAPLLWLASSCATTRAPDWSAIQDELASRVALDQELRGKLQLGGEMDMEVVHRMEEVDHDNTAWLMALVERHGWPTISRVGKEGAQGAWLLIQHAELEFQEQCLPLLRAALAEKDVSAQHVAYLEDRIHMRRGRPQRYGTQFTFGANGLEVHTLEDEERVDEWRAEIGLGPLAEYEAQLRGEN
jgi:hypothetical protein